MPNFTKYESQAQYSKNLRLVLPKAAVLAAEENKLWDTMLQRIKYDTNEEMWGF